MSTIIVITPHPNTQTAIVDLNVDSTDTERKHWIKENKDAILAKVSEAIDRL
jgi:hypothetical protein